MCNFFKNFEYCNKNLGKTSKLLGRCSWLGRFRISQEVRTLHQLDPQSNDNPWLKKYMKKVFERHKDNTN